MSRLTVPTRPGRAGKHQTARVLPRRYHHGNLRAALLAAAIKIVDQRGADGLTIRLVAQQAGVSHNAPYHHFRDKGAILEAATVSCINALVEVMCDKQKKTQGGSVDKIIAMGVEFVRFAIEHPAEFRLMYRPELRKSRDGCCGDAPSSPVEGASASGRNLLLQIIRGGQDAGEIVPGDPDMLVLTWWCLVNGYANKVLNLQHKRSRICDKKALATAHQLLVHLAIGMRLE